MARINKVLKLLNTMIQSTINDTIKISKAILVDIQTYLHVQHA